MISVYFISSYQDKLSDKIRKKIEQINSYRSPGGRLEQWGLNIKSDRIKVGENIDREIQSTINDCDVYVILWSSSCYVEETKELKGFSSEEITLITDKIDKAYIIPIIIGAANPEILLDALTRNDTSKKAKIENILRISIDRTSNHHLNDTCRDIYYQIMNITTAFLKFPFDFKKSFLAGSESFLNIFFKNYHGGIFIEIGKTVSYAEVLDMALKRTRINFWLP